MKAIILWMNLGFLCSGLSAAETSAAKPQPLKSLHSLIVPAAEELAWQKIPWKIDLLAARRKAAREDKPIFLWEMDGHPLGCT